ncbi:unnamed protein product [Cuscuta epithymum]|uniref:AP2/ERF domain-containing protein n=1 Tax=Cuscuta epithymum TaxID=186058 RepID=A0AAV0CIM4_9ASTE|nr:unnamed protein product [Cuscuta epithymum]
MSETQQRFRGVRQRRMGWTAEIRHPLLKNKICIGTYKKAEDAARAYDEAARLIHGEKAKQNFPYEAASDDSESSTSVKFLSAKLIAKIQRCQKASVDLAKSLAGASRGQKYLSPTAVSSGVGVAEKKNERNGSIDPPESSVGCQGR